MRWFIAGIVSLGLLLGFLVGASHTPVAGVAITATFGLLAAVFALHQKATVEKALVFKQDLVKQLDELQPRITSALNTLGRTLFVFALAFGIGLAFGIYLRLAQPFGANKPPATFPWEGSMEPISSKSAIDWILVQEKLRIMGYGDNQIKALYEKDRKSKNDNLPFPYESDLLSPLLSDIQPDIRGTQRPDGRYIAEHWEPKGWADGYDS